MHMALHGSVLQDNSRAIEPALQSRAERDLRYCSRLQSLSLKIAMLSRAETDARVFTVSEGFSRAVSQIESVRMTARSRETVCWHGNDSRSARRVPSEGRVNTSEPWERERVDARDLRYHSFMLHVSAGLTLKLIFDEPAVSLSFLSSSLSFSISSKIQNIENIREKGKDKCIFAIFSLANLKLGQSLAILDSYQITEMNDLWNDRDG